MASAVPLLILPGDMVRDRNPGSPLFRVYKVVDSVVTLDNGRPLPVNMCVLEKRGPGHALMAGLAKAREATGKFSDKPIKQGDAVKVTGPVPNKGKRGKVAMVAGNGHVVTHDDGSHMVYDEKHLSHDSQGDQP